jgi:membrane protein implicated in regulation of membrane protease activity
MMYIVAIGWMFVVTLMAVVEAVSTNGSLLGAVMTFVFYGLLPLALVLYLLGTPLRRRHLKKQDHLAASQTKQEDQ